MTMHYISTRGGAPVLDFSAATLAGLASDGGLYVPESLPRFSEADMAAMAKDDYKTLAVKILSVFTGGDMPLQDIVQRAYAGFDHADITPLKKINDKTWILELFHGPTLAFKDVALQFLGQAFEHILRQQNKRVTIVAATSGDTGSAALDAFQNRANVNIVVLHPAGRVSEVQRRQMTGVNSPNVMNIALAGSFDDCQAMVKAMFADADFSARVGLSAVNSINWGRIAAQVVYYAYAALRFRAETGKPAVFSVPTGNFGNVYAGFIARALGFPIDRLIIATNANDILYRFFQGGEMKKTGVTPTLSPSMDIQVSSNFERLLFDMLRHDGQKTAALFKQFQDKGVFTVPPEILAQIHSIFSAHRADDAQTLNVMCDFYRQQGYILDPHTAVGMAAAEATGVPVITLATAHPAKFPDAVEKATGIKPNLPAHLQDLFTRPEKYERMDNDRLNVQRAILARFGG